MTDCKKVVIVTGANRGIGKSVSDELIKNGYRVILAIRSLEVVKEFDQNDSDNVHVIQYDAKSNESAKKLVNESINKYGRLDALVNCAGVLLNSSLEDDDETALDEMLEVNFKGPLRLIKLALPHLRKCGEGRIVNLVSLSGKRVKGRSIGYAASKHALMALTHTARFAGWDDGVRATAICPGWVNTDMVSEFGVVKQEEMTQPEDIAKLIHTIIELPNTASVAELTINCLLESSF